MANIVLNAMGEPCPRPVILAKQALDAAREAGTLEVHADNEAASQNLLRLASSRGLKATSERVQDAEWVVRMELHAPAAKQDDAGAPVCTLDACGDFIVAVDTEAMGRGDDALGRALMKGFLYAVSQLDVLPKTILFYNGGAKLSVVGSPNVEDLKKMEERGVEILTCGTCLNFYGLTESLAVGSITNMYTIVEKLAGAAKVIKP